MPRRSARTAGHAAQDTNIVIAGLLRDLASAQTSPPSKWGYKRAAAAVRDLEVPIESLVLPDGTLAKILHVGPSSSRVIFEVLDSGVSATVEQTVAASSKRSEVERSRTLRGAFLSRARVVAVLADPALDGPTREGYRGDLQMHSVWSDGSQSLDDIWQTGLARRYAYSAVTDHSYGLPIAGGVSMDRLAEQHREIDRLNQVHRGTFRLLKGIEANVRADGSVDLTPDELARFDLVVAAPHSVLRSAADQTARMLAAVRTEGVHILGHPRGRMYGSRAGVSADWDRVFDEAARLGVAVEIDGDPSRQDLDYVLAGKALRSGCLFALDSDAHGTAEWRYAETAIAHARLAGIPPDRVVNYWPLERLIGWTQSRQAYQSVLR
jgi:putative hydrolase